MQSFTAKESSNVGWARYDPETQILEIDFRDKHGNKASTYSYAGFPAEQWERFRLSESKGRFFAYEIRPKYQGIKKIA